jgi:sugar/nucleoside kinase (ribokinase family)
LSFNSSGFGKNVNELEELISADVKAAARYFINLGCKIVVVTLGKGNVEKNKLFQLSLFDHTPPEILSQEHINMRNEIETLRYASFIVDSAGEYFIESKPKNVVDTTGAGDAFATGFLYGLINRMQTKECGRLGDITAQFAISKIGARQGLPTENQLKTRYNKLYKRDFIKSSTECIPI